VSPALSQIGKKKMPTISAATNPRPTTRLFGQPRDFSADLGERAKSSSAAKTGGNARTPRPKLENARDLLMSQRFGSRPTINAARAKVEINLPLARVGGFNSISQNQTKTSESDLGKATLRRIGDTAARRLYRAMKGLGTDEKAVFATLENRTPTELEYIRESFHTLTGEPLDSWLRADLSFGDEKRALALLRSAPQE